MIEFMRGIRMPLNTTSRPASLRMASNRAGNFPARSRIRNRARYSPKPHGTYPHNGSKPGSGKRIDALHAIELTAAGNSTGILGAGVSDLKADTGRLKECSRSLQRIYDEFTNRADPADGYSEGELGDSRIVSAFKDFGDNWRIHREHLADKIRTLGTITEDAAMTYEGVDAQLAAALRKQDKAAAHGGGFK